MPETIKVHTPHQAHCKDCSLAALCLPLSLNLEDMDALDEIVIEWRKALEENAELKAKLAAYESGSTPAPAAAAEPDAAPMAAVAVPMVGTLGTLA